MKLNLSNCDREPIHIPGKIQSYGYLIALEITSQRIAFCSENIHEIFDVPHQEVLGKSLLNIDERQKVPHLMKDVGVLNENINLDFELNNSDEALGGLYVLEGAALGGNVIKKQLLQNPEFANLSFHYYGMYGEKLSEYWKSFLKILEENVSDKDAALSGASKTYHLFLKSSESTMQ